MLSLARFTSFSSRCADVLPTACATSLSPPSSRRLLTNLEIIPHQRASSSQRMLRAASLQKQLASVISNALAKNGWRGCSDPARRLARLHTAPPLGSSIEAGPSDQSRPPFKILFAGGDRFSIASLDALAKQSKGRPGGVCRRRTQSANAET